MQSHRCQATTGCSHAAPCRSITTGMRRGGAYTSPTGACAEHRTIVRGPTTTQARLRMHEFFPPPTPPTALPISATNETMTSTSDRGRRSPSRLPMAALRRPWGLHECDVRRHKSRTRCFRKGMRRRIISAKPHTYHQLKSRCCRSRHANAIWHDVLTNLRLRQRVSINLGCGRGVKHDPRHCGCHPRTDCMLMHAFGVGVSSRLLVSTSTHCSVRSPVSPTCERGDPIVWMPLA